MAPARSVLRIVFVVLGSAALLLAPVHQLTAQTCPPADVPDNLHQDLNYDGIDGDTAGAIFVSSAAGNDLNPGTMSLPLATLEAAIAMASDSGKDVYVAAGVYSPVSTLFLSSGVSLYGQFDGPPSWGRSESNVTVINTTPNGILANGLVADVYFEGFTVNAADGASLFAPNSYGIRIHGGSARTYVRHNTITAGNGFGGSNGPDGTNGANGGTGGNGGVGACDADPGANAGAGGISTCGRGGGAGGTGGYGNTSGAAGSIGIGPAFGFGGSGGAGSNTVITPGGNGNAGTPGGNGSHGSSGGVGPSMGSLAAGSYFPANGNNGIGGLSGSGGGGGGGGGGQTCLLFCTAGRGDGGGGGGAGGCGGSAGGGGTGGGGSFAIIVTGGALATIHHNDLITGSGGNGGKGGNGSTGGTGGPGGVGFSTCGGEVGGGGNGGNGGNGGHGGNGSGASGGPSICIAVSGATVDTAANKMTYGLGGFGGAGGFSAFFGSSPSGSNGMSAAMLGPANALLVTPAICLSDVSVDEDGAGQVIATVTLYLQEQSPDTTKVDWATGDSTATQAGDFQYTTGTAEFAPGVLSTEVEILVDADLLVEGTEEFLLVLSNPQGGTIVDTIGVITIIDFPLTSFELSYPQRWSMVSLPMLVADGAAGTLFPGLLSPPTWYDPVSGYQDQDTLEQGSGYWIFLESPDTYGIDGLPVTQTTIPVLPGWNMIGTVSGPVAVSEIVTNPPELEVYGVYGYDNGYYPADSLLPATGYWALVSDTGEIILDYTPSANRPKASAKVHVQQEQGWNALVFSVGLDGAAGSGASAGSAGSGRRNTTQKLFFGESDGNDATLKRHALPPVPPPGGFDARFTTQRNLALIPREGADEHQIQISSGSYPVAIEVELVGPPPAASLIVNGTARRLRDGEKFLLQGPGDRVSLGLSAGASVPVEFTLDQNYPNPFNPSTVVTYGLPVDAMTTLRLYNSLGQEVRVLVNEVREAGFHSVTFEAGGLPSGTYFYRMDAAPTGGGKSFTSSRKMLFIK